MDTNWISLCVQMIGVVIAILSYKLQLHNNTHEKQVPPINGDAQSGPINTVLSNNGKNVNIAKVFMVIGILFFASGFSYNIYELIKNDDGLEQRPGDRQFPIVNQTEPLLVFAGGGSVVNMIKEITKGSVDIKTIEIVIPFILICQAQMLGLYWQKKL